MTVLPEASGGPAFGADGLWRGHFRAMASDIELTLTDTCADRDAALADVMDVFAGVTEQCSRFDPDSDLMTANASAEQWCAVGPYCFAAIEAAAQAHLRTAGRFDPRVLDALIALGYDRSRPFEDAELDLAPGPSIGAERSPLAWQPDLDRPGSRVRIGPVPIDLGGIGKGLAVRWAAERVAQRCDAFLLDAGGDCYLGGPGPDGTGWSVGVEDPGGGAQPVAVLALTDQACATSSVRVRRWKVGGVPVHHLIDPATGAPGGEGLLSVTVVDDDAADAEVWSKTLFLAGAPGIAAAAERAGVAALWVDSDGRIDASAAMWSVVRWCAQ